MAVSFEFLFFSIAKKTHYSLLYIETIIETILNSNQAFRSALVSSHG